MGREEKKIEREKEKDQVRKKNKNKSTHNYSVSIYSSYKAALNSCSSEEIFLCIGSLWSVSRECLGRKGGRGGSVKMMTMVMVQRIPSLLEFFAGKTSIHPS